MERDVCKNKKERYAFLDSLRGICVVGMVFYHTLFDIFALRGEDVNAGWFLWMNVLRDFGAALFIFLSGVCFHFCARRLRRFLLLTASGAVVSVITHIVLPDGAVMFGILTFMGASGGLLWLLEKPLTRITPLAGFVVSCLLFAFLFGVNFGFIGFFRLPVFYVPRFFYRNYITAFFGFPFEGFASSDFFSLLPWFCICLAGFYFFPLIRRRERVVGVLKWRLPVLASIGRWSLPLYLLHQPVIFGVLFLLLRWQA